MLILLISKEVFILMYQVVQDLWQSWSSFVLTPESASILYLLMYVTFSITILKNLLQILTVPSKLWSVVKNLVVRLLPKSKKAQARQLVDLITTIEEVTKDAEQRLQSIHESARGQQETAQYLDDARTGDVQLKRG